MPYFTKKGTGKDKGKTCVFKKEDKTKVGCTDGPIQKYMAALHMNESDFEWVKGPVTVKLGDIAENIGDYLSVGDTIHVSGDFTLNDYDEILEINHSAEIIGITSMAEEKDSLRVDFGVKMLQIPEWEANFSSGEVDLGEPLGVMSDYELLITLPTPKNMNESDEWEWVKEVPTDLVDGEIYDIKTSNGYYWVPEKFIGREWDDEYDVEMYKFKDLNGRGSGGRSVPYIKELMSKGHIRPYDPNWSIKDEITFSDNLEDALKGNFVVYFKDGVQLDQTLRIQDKLFEMGFSFYTKGPNEYITNEDSPGQIQFFECINWDTSNPRYKSMPSNQRDLKKILLSKVRDDETRWRPEPNPRLDEQELFLIVVDHDAIVINGDKYIGGDITESEDNTFKWVEEIKPELTQELFISVIENHPWFSVDLDGSYVEVDISDEFIEDIGDLVGSGLITIDFRSDVLKQIKSEFTWSPDEARRLQGYSGLVRLIIVMDELARLLEPLVGRDNVRYYSHYLSENNRNIVSEVAGISFESRKWSEIIENEIKNNPNETERLIIDGYNYPEAFNSFPIDYIIVDFYDKITGYSQDYSGYDKDGNYIVLLYIQPQLINGHGGFSLRSALNHEMKHAWQDYNRLSKGLPSIDQTKESEKLYTKDFIKMLSDQNVRGPIKEILKYHYYLSKLETSPYLENVYDGDNSYERLVREIVSKDFEEFKEKFDLEVNWHLMNTMYDIPFLQKFKSSLDFIDYSAEELRSRALKMIKKINKMRYIHGKSH